MCDYMTSILCSDLNGPRCAIYYCLVNQVFVSLEIMDRKISLDELNHCFADS